MDFAVVVLICKGLGKLLQVSQTHQAKSHLLRKQLVKKTIVVTMGMVAISAVVGLVMNLGKGASTEGGELTAKTIDPIVDMARTMLNVTGSLTNALMVGKQNGQINMDVYNDMKAGK
jgi:L-cystine uptake protein TcyP (sodium:dicarboxylate symporter family)